MTKRMLVQRRPGQADTSGLSRPHAASAAAREPLPLRVNGVSHPAGQPLDAATRAFMEPRFGHDFSQVQVHTGTQAAQSAEALNALAYTVGQDVIFGAGQFAPDTSTGRRLIAHELAHVVQQHAHMPPTGEASQAMMLSERSDAAEQEADRVAAAVADAPSQRPAEKAPTQPRFLPEHTVAQTVQRYQAGETGHGGIEERALRSARFSPDQIGRVYFGNWLRDLSQLPPKALPLINILALGEFNRQIQASDLGTYVPSEHLDNPMGGDTIEDPRIQDLEDSPDPAKRAQFEAALAKLSPEQRKAYDEEQDRRREITEAVNKSGLPDYIERGKLHAKERLVKAIELGETPEGSAAMGNGLHAVEDYFSHSNFVEVAIWTLYRDGAPVGALVDRMAHTTLGANAALVGGMDAQGRPQILTGTYRGGGNDWVSRFELIKTEIEHGQLTKAFILGWLRHQGIEREELGRRLGGEAGGLVGALAGSIGGGLEGTWSGASAGAASGWETHSGLSAAWHAVTGALGGAVSGALEGGEAGWSSGERAGSELGQAAGRTLGYGAGIVEGTLEELVAGASVAALMAAFPPIDIAMATLIAAAETDVVAKHETDVSAQEAKAANMTGPTHSQIAKDAPDNPLFGVSVQLAEEVDKQIGSAMLAAWATTPAETSPTPDVVSSVTKLVDKFVSHPSADPWWRDIVQKNAK